MVAEVLRMAEPSCMGEFKGYGFLTYGVMQSMCI